jgi:hypothetical protein
VKGIAHKAEWNYLVFVHDIERNHARDVFGRAKLVKIHLGAAKLLGYKLQKSIFIDDAQLYQSSPYALSGMPLLFECAVELLGGYNTFVDQQFPYFLGHSSKSFQSGFSSQKLNRVGNKTRSSNLATQSLLALA